MRNHIKKKLMLLLLGFIFGFSILIHSNLIHYQGKVTGNLKNDNEPELKRAGYWNVPPFIISGNSGWETINSTYEWCNGNGTWSKPYIIENITVDGQNSGNCIEIRNSDVYFVIKNCEIINSGTVLDDAGIYLESANNGLFINNDFTNNNYGLYLYQNSDNNTIRENLVSNNHIGLRFRYSDFITIFDNSINYNDVGLDQFGCDNSTISGNTIISQFDPSYSYETGLQLTLCTYTNVEDNIIIDSTHRAMSMGSCKFMNITNNFIDLVNGGFGIHSYESNNISISKNTIINGVRGLTLQWSDNHTIFGNVISNHFEVGIRLSQSYDNLIYDNTFSGNGINGEDKFAPTRNSWDNGSLGNYWDDYKGYDLDDNGIGDSPYYILGDSNSQDNFPIILDVPPEITINSPISSEVFYNNSPQFNLTIYDANLDKMWYSIEGILRNFYITEMLGVINQTVWESLPLGNVNLKFYANDTRGNLVNKNVVVIKESPSKPREPTISGHNLFVLLGVLSVAIIIIGRKWRNLRV